MMFLIMCFVFYPLGVRRLLFVVKSGFFVLSLKFGLL